MRTSPIYKVGAFAFAGLCIGNLNASEDWPKDAEAARQLFSTPDRNLIEYPGWEAPSEEVVELGRQLFFDDKLSVNESQSCATCHNPDHGFSDGLAFSIGAMGNPVRRNTPHLYNLAWNNVFFWDGRAHSLEDQALGPIEAAGEMNMPLPLLLERLESDLRYKAGFKAAFGDGEITGERVATAIASFERTIIVDDTPFDRYLAGNEDAIGPAAKRGMVLYAGKGKCMDCHDGPNFTDNSFHNIGVSNNDTGRKEIIKDDGLAGAFKVPGLRNILYSAPYMHDGSLGTLEEVVRFYNKGGEGKEGESVSIVPLNLTEPEIRDLVAFLGTLNQPLEIARPDRQKDDSVKVASAE